MKMKIKNRSHRYDINRPRSKYGHKYSKYKTFLSIVMLICIKQHLSNICSSIHERVKVGLSPSKNICVICLIESPLKMMKNAFYFILKALFILKIFKFLPRLLGHVGKTA